MAVPCPPIFDTTGADVDAPKGENEELVVPADWTPTVPEGAGADEVPKAEGGIPKAEEVVPNAELPRPPKTFDVVLRFANAEAAGGTELAAEGIAVPVSGLGVPKADVGGGPKAEVDGGAPTMTEGEGRTPKVSESHSVALGFNGWGWC